MVLGDVASDDHVHRKTYGCSIKGGDCKDSPGPKRLQDCPQKRRVAGKNVFEGRLHPKVISQRRHGGTEKFKGLALCSEIVPERRNSEFT